MSPEINYLPEGCALPEAAALELFWQSAVAARPRLAAADACQVRWIGLDHESTVRALAVWKPLHTRYWNAMLKPFGLEVTADMPVLVERLQLMARPGPAPVAR